MYLQTFPYYAYGDLSECESFPTRPSSDLSSRNRCLRKTRRSGKAWKRPWARPPRRKSASRRSTPRTPSRTRTSTSRSEEHTSELQSQSNLVCRLLLEKKIMQLKSQFHYTA